MKIYSKEGLCMVDVKSVKRNGENLVMNCKLMGAYSMPIYLRPEELREALKLVDWELISYLPEMLVTGTRGEEKFREIGGNLAELAGKNVDILIGEESRKRLLGLGKAMGAASVESLFNCLMLMLQIMLENKEK